MRSKGFTLVELLAVIVILAIILAIAIPTISNMINSSTKSTFESSAKLVLKGIEYKMLEDSTFDPTSITESNIETSLNIDDSNYKSITVKKVNDVLHITIVGQNKWNKYTVSGTKVTTKVSDTITSFTGGANKPALVTGMTPIKWDSTENKWVDTTESDSEWYSYTTTDKKWANARTEDGSMWVWIPRYVYRITSGWHTSTTGTIDIQFSKGVDDNWNKAVIGAIDLREGAEASDAATNGNKYTNHPAFTFGDTELTGIWVAKFEASSSNPSAQYYGGDDLTLKVKSVPNVNAWLGIYLRSIFTVTRNMETDATYGWDGTGSGIDTHLTKNTEWGAMLYLAQSAYGKNNQIWPNNSSNYVTGCAGSSATYAGYTGCEYTYNTDNGQQASTTGNIYGIYDIIGGTTGKRVAAYLNTNSASFIYGDALVNADQKYKDLYTAGVTDSAADNYALTINKKGDAIYETSVIETNITSWYNDGINFVSNISPFIVRGYPRTGSGYGTFYSFGSWKVGLGVTPYGFRPTLVVGAGL